MGLGIIIKIYIIIYRILNKKKSIIYPIFK